MRQGLIVPELSKEWEKNIHTRKQRRLNIFLWYTCTPLFRYAAYLPAQSCRQQDLTDYSLPGKRALKMRTGDKSDPSKVSPAFQSSLTTCRDKVKVVVGETKAQSGCLLSVTSLP
ncbi:hypothetical protein BaRGS_00005638 [Batillaria attramentaria]|uniref:Uncharacterized protein n=1 Tax=Batillaria attramentaria TaxID=370345 RepID=A0ABD0LU49_9CAEN